MASKRMAMLALAVRLTFCAVLAAPGARAGEDDAALRPDQAAVVDIFRT
ncbi:hypothetical protein [Niveispirillum fermenti]